MKPSLPRVAITMGDPAGVGPEVIAQALCRPTVRRCSRPVVYGHARRLRDGAATTASPIIFYSIESIDAIDDNRPGIPVITPALCGRPDASWGMPTAGNGAAMAAYVEAAIEDALNGRVAAIATAPINKHALRLAGVPCIGHTEILTQRCGAGTTAMMLAGNRLKVVLATIHVPIREVPVKLTTEGLATVIGLTDHALRSRFGIAAPRIAVAGLNPHAGEGGLFGDEERTIIQPAVDSGVSQGMAVTGPHPPDTVFCMAARGAFDAVVAMYHDQGLGPFKMIHFDDGVNTTLGLPIIRTSVDHGTAYDIAGTGRASPASMEAAIVMAATHVRNQSTTRPASIV